MINTVYFEKGSNFANVYNLYQWDYGQSLEIKGLDIHDNVWVQFSMNASGGNAIPVVTEVNDGIITANIPAFVFEKETSQNYNAYAFVYVSNADSGETVKVIKLNIKARPKPEDYVYTEPEKQRYEILENLIKSFLNSNGEIDPKKIHDMYYEEDGNVNTIKEKYLGFDWVPKIREDNIEIFKEQHITVEESNSVGKGLFLHDLNIDQETRNRIIDEFESLTLVLDGNKIELPYVKKFEEDGYVNAAIFTQEPYSVEGNNLAGSVIVGKGKNASMQVVLTLGEYTLEVRHINVTPNPLPAELLTDGTPYLEKTFSEILPEMTAETSDLYGGEMRLPIGLELFEGDEYNVKWQGKEYDCKCFSIEIDGVKINVLGDAYTLSGGEVGKEATGEPFCFFIYPKELQGMINASGSCTPVPHVSNERFTFSIDGYKKKLRKLPEECLPDSIKELLNGSLPNIKVDSELSKTSTNPVQNKVVAEAVEKLSEEIVDEIESRKNAIKELSEQKANVIVESANGNNIVITDSTDEKLRGMRLFGKSTQFTTTGAQLFDIDNPTRPGEIIQANGTFGKNEKFNSYRIENNISLFITYEKGTSFDGLRYGLETNGVIERKIIQTERLKFNENSYDAIWLTIDPREQYQKNIMVNTGTNYLPYEPYTGGKPSPNKDYQQPIESVGDDGSVDVKVYGSSVDDASTELQSLITSTPNGLLGVQVNSNSLATYTDANGVMWVADEIDFERGKRVQRIGIIENYDNEEIADVYLSTTGELSEGATVYYILAKPIEHDLTAEEIEAYKALHANYPTTTVTSDAFVEVKYMADTKNYIDNKFAELKTAIIALGGV